MNYAALSNTSPAIHVHIIPRYQDPREFSGVIFKDARWGSNYAPYDRSFELEEFVAPHLWKLLFELDRIAGLGSKVKRGLSVLRSFISALNVTVNDVTVGLDIEPERGTADSGDSELLTSEEFDLSYVKSKNQLFARFKFHLHTTQLA